MQTQSLIHLYRDALSALGLGGRVELKNVADVLRALAVLAGLTVLYAAFTAMASSIMGSLTPLVEGSFWLSLLAVVLSVVLAASLLLISLVLSADFVLARSSLLKEGMLAVPFLPLSLWASACLHRAAEPPRALS